MHESATVVLRKPGKPDYTVLATYQPIMLLNTITKLLSSCIAEDLVQMSEAYDILPTNHFRCRPGPTTSDSLHYVTKIVKDTWRKREVVSALFLDIKSTFLSVILTQLIHNMRCRGVPT